MEIIDLSAQNLKKDNKDKNLDNILFIRNPIYPDYSLVYINFFYQIILLYRIP